MNNIITDLQKDFSKGLGKILNQVMTDSASDISEVIISCEELFNSLGIEFIKKMLEETDKEIRQSVDRKKKWVIKQNQMDKSLITKFGMVNYQRTYFESKTDEGYTYLVDDFFDIERYQRMDEGLTADIIRLSRDYSYQKSVNLAVESVNLSRQTVKNKIRKLGEIDSSSHKRTPVKKKRVKRLYVEADEDHIALQNGTNTIVKLVYVHEGKESQAGRLSLKNPNYFSGLYSENENLWLEVVDYIYANYDTEEIETIYLAGDGANWIYEGLNWLPNSKYVLDRYHLNKAVIKATGHMPTKRPKLWIALNECDFDKTRDILNEIVKTTEIETKRKAVKDSKRYILNNWGGIKIYKEDPYVLGCSAEGHVSHVLAARMSSRPLGWSRQGADQMARLRAFKYNGGKVVDIKRLIEKRRKKKKMDKKLKKRLRKSSKKSLYAEPKEVMPALAKGVVNGTYQAIKNYAF